jgi:hypothetical protein
MNALSRLACICSIASGVFLSPLRAGDMTVQYESFGKLSFGQKAESVTALFGKPESKGKDTLWEATGEWVQEWRYTAQGLRLNMASDKKSGAKTVATITATAPCPLATARGIRVGSSMAEVTKAYKNVQDKEMSDPGKSFVAGSVYGGVIFSFKEGKVSQIFVGAAAE